MWPWRSPRIWTSMWRARRTKRSRKTASLPKAAAGFAAGLLQLAGELGGLIHHAHAASAAAEGRLDDQREADFGGDLLRLLRVGHRLLGAGNHRNAGALGQAARRGLVAQQFEQLRAGADEGDAGALAGARQRRILGEKAVAGMDRIDALFLGQRDDAFHIEVGLHRALALRRSGRLHRP